MITFETLEVERMHFKQMKKTPEHFTQEMMDESLNTIWKNSVDRAGRRIK